MENLQSYFGEVGAAIKTLAVGMKTTLKEYFTPKSTEQYPENRKTTLHVAARHRGRLVFKRNDDNSYKCTACTLCEKACPNGTIKIVAHMEEDPETGRKKKVLDDYQYDLATTLVTACSASCALMPATSEPLSSPTTSRMLSSTAASWCCTSTRRFTREARFPDFLTEAHQSLSVSLTLKPSNNRLWQI